MRTPDRLPDDALASLLDGSPSEEAVGTPLAAYLDAVRHDAVTTEPRASAELGVVLARGLDPAELEVGDMAAAMGAGSTSWRRRGRVALRVLIAKFAALGLLGKAAAAGAAVTVVASGAGVAGVLPPPAQTTFDDVVGREAPPDDVDVDDHEGAGDGDTTPPETSADTADTEPLDTDVPDDATGSSDGEPGVDGGDVADDASDGQGAAAQDAPDEQPAGPGDTPARDKVQDVPADEMRDGRPPTPAPAEERAADGGDAAPQGDVGERPDDPAAAPPARGHRQSD